MARVLTVTANPLLDFLGRGPVISGRIQRLDSFTPTVGGKGLNMARVLASHGHEVLAGGFIGGALGDVLAGLVAADGVTPAFTRVPGATRIGFQMIDPQGNTSVMERGVPVTVEDGQRLLATTRQQLSGCALLIIGGAPPAGGEDLYAALATVAAEAGVPCWIDAYGPALARALAGDHPPALVKPNREEFATDTHWDRAAELHLSDGPGMVRVRSPWGDFQVVPPDIIEVNPVGSGDCYVAALAHARLVGWPLVDQLRYAAAAGAANALRVDVAMIGPAEITALAPHVTVAPG